MSGWAEGIPGDVVGARVTRQRQLRIGGALPPSVGKAYLVAYLRADGTWLSGIFSESTPTLPGDRSVVATAVVCEADGKDFGEARENLLDLIRQRYGAVGAEALLRDRRRR